MASFQAKGVPMKIRRCPVCAKLVHFEANRPVERCWNCGRVSDFSLIQSPDQRLGSWLVNGAETILGSLFFLWPRSVRAGRAALVVAMPFAILMLLICNSFDVRVVNDLTASFSGP